MSEPQNDPILGSKAERAEETALASSRATAPSGDPDGVFRRVSGSDSGSDSGNVSGADSGKGPGNNLGNELVNELGDIPEQNAVSNSAPRKWSGWRLPLPVTAPPAWLLACLLLYTAVWTLTQGFTTPGLPLTVLQDYASALLAQHPAGLKQALLLGWFKLAPHQAFYYHLLIQSLLALTGLFIWLIARRLHGAGAAYIALFSLVFLPVVSLTGAPELDSIILLLPLWFAVIFALLTICGGTPRWLVRTSAYGLLLAAAFLLSLESNALLILMISFVAWLASSGLLLVAFRAGRYTAARRALFTRVLLAKVALPLVLMALAWIAGAFAKQAWFSPADYKHLLTGGHFRALSVVLVSFGTLAVGAFLFRLRFRFRQRLWFEHPKLERTFAFNMLFVSGLLALASWFIPPLFGFVWGAVQPLERLAALVYVALPPFLLFWSTNLPEGRVPLRRAGTALGAMLGFALAVGTANLLLPNTVKRTSEPWQRIGNAFTLATQRSGRPTPEYLLVDQNLALGAGFFYQGRSQLVALQEGAKYAAINGDNAMAICENGGQTCAQAIKTLGADRLLESLIAKLDDPRDPDNKIELMVLWPLPVDGYEGLQSKPKNPLSLLPAPAKDDGQALPPGLQLTSP